MAERISGGEARVEIAVPVETVWSRVSDPTRVGEWSPENRGARWVKGASGPALGARFRGLNRRGVAVWTTTCTIVRYEPERAIAWETTPPWGGPPIARWTYEVEPTEGGTAVVERWEILNLTAPVRASMVVMVGNVDKRLAILRRSLGESLHKLKAVLESESVDATGAGQA